MADLCSIPPKHLQPLVGCYISNDINRGNELACRLPTSGNLECDRLERVIFSDESRFSLSADDHRHVSGRRIASGPIRHLNLSSGLQQFGRCDSVSGAISWDTRSSLVFLQGTL
ncbi:hypothetical protein TNCV_3503671 [Trichonephila clavipes]|uniref:Uncharacterized protein n=1 Tax=Trichonephila clavipes TaxID=2585209 RepID=A0A8X6RXH9_TRICX|nr:hypothetical protein TNCV_3503671 [Trichonephila clavipes]